MAKKRDIYVMSNGQPVTEGSVSQIVGIIDKSGPLMGWAVKEAALKIEELWLPDVAHPKPYVEFAIIESKRAHRVKKDTAGDIGTRAHLIVGAYAEGQLLPEHIEDADEKRSLENFIGATEGWEWLGSEMVLVGEWLECDCVDVKYQSNYCGAEEEGYCEDDVCEECGKKLKMFGYGGTADAIARLPDGRIHLIDFKTSNSVHATYTMQCALYAYARPVDDYAHLREYWKEIQEARILHFDKELLTWESLERDIREQKRYMHSFIQCTRWKKKFDPPNYSNYQKKEKKVKEPLPEIPGPMAFESTARRK